MSGDVPARLVVRRFHETAEERTMTDPDVLQDLWNSVEGIQPVEKTLVMVTDCTDLLIFTFADGTVRRLELEGNAVVTEEGERYTASGIKEIRRQMNGLFRD